MNKLQILLLIGETMWLQIYTGRAIRWWSILTMVVTQVAVKFDDTGLQFAVHVCIVYDGEL